MYSLPQSYNQTSRFKRCIYSNAYRDCTVWIPELAEQKRIGKLLRSLDRKIELNRAINQNLEALAKQLYDYWFVQFDFPNEDGKPYKSSGGKMVWNEKLKREIPEGWNISLIKDIATTYSGGTPKSTNIEYYNNGDIAWINSGELNSPIITKTINYITKCGLENSSAKLYPSNSILVAMYGATAGKVSLLTFEACSNQAVCGVIPTIENMLYYVYFHISSLYGHFITLSTGSARDNISQDTIKNILLLIPTRNILKLFDEKIGNIYQTIVNNYQQIDSLTKQRDELLPLLMNGQVSVNSDLSVYKKKRRGRIPSLTLNQVSDIQILHRQSIVLLTKQVLMDELQSERLIILVIIPFGTEIFVPIAWHVLLEETSQVFQAFGLVLLEVAAHDDDAPVGEVASSVAVLPEADVAVQITLTDVHAKAVGILHHATTVSVAELLTQVEIEIKNQIFLFHN